METIRTRQMEEEIALLRKALLATQWGFNHSRCPVCAGWMMGPYGETDFKHTDDCIVRKALNLPHLTEAIGR